MGWWGTWVGMVGEEGRYYRTVVVSLLQVFFFFYDNKIFLRKRYFNPYIPFSLSPISTWAPDKI